MRKSITSKSDSKRLGAVAVEFAVVLPLLTAITFGMIEASRVLDVQNTLEIAAREGARFAAMDRSGMLQEGQTTNTKLVADVKYFLETAGISADDVTVSVSPYGSPEQPFDLDLPANDLELFQVKIDVPLSDVSYMPVSEDLDYSLSATVVFRNGQAILSE